MRKGTEAPLFPLQGGEESQGFSYALAFGVKHCPSQASLLAQTVKNLPAMQDTCIVIDPLIPRLGKSLGEGTGNPL